MGKAFLVPSLFNINEPVVFGTIVWNPFLMIPMWIQGVVLPIIIWIALKTGLGQVPTKVFQMWYIPFPINTWINGGTIGSLILVIVIFVVSSVIWYPFFKAYDKQLLISEDNNNGK